MIMIANMKHAAIVDVTLSIAVKALRLALINLVSVRCERLLEGWREGLLGGYGGNCRIKFLQGVAAVFAARVEPIRPGLGNAFHQILAFGSDLAWQCFQTNACRLQRLPGLVVRLLYLLASGRDDLFGGIDHRLLNFR